MAFPWLLPLLLGGADPQVIATGDTTRVEEALSDGIRRKVADGWVVIDVRYQYTTANELHVTLSKGDVFEKHVVKFDATDTYSVVADVAEPTDTEDPGGYLALALAAPNGGGVELESTCGEYYLRPYIVDEHATGEFASSLVARVLGTADNLTSAREETGRITFTIQKKDIGRELVVWLDRKNTVIEAQVRRFEYQGGGAVYKRMSALKKQLAKTRVVGIKGTTLILPKGGTFALDPNGEALSYSDHEGGCGC